MSKTFDKYMKLLDETRPWTETELIYFRKALGGSGLKCDIEHMLLCARFKTRCDVRPIQITREHQTKGTEYLLSKSLTKRGTLRKGSRLGSREIEILKAEPTHELVGLYQTGDKYFPIYRATAGEKFFEYLGVTYEMMKVFR